MTAVSTALRKRWRTAFIRHGQNFFEKVLSDSVAVDVDKIVDTYTVIKEGERVDILNDSFSVQEGTLQGSFDSLAASDSFVIEKGIYRSVLDSVDVTDSIEIETIAYPVLSDAVSIIDFLLPQHVPYQDPQVTTSLTIPFWINAFAVTDNVIATPVLAPVVNFVTLSESLLLVDSITVSGSKLNSRNITDSVLSLNESVGVTVTRTTLPPGVSSRIISDSIAVSDSVVSTFVGVVLRALGDSVTANDSLLRFVSRPVDLNEQVADFVDSIITLREINRRFLEPLPTDLQEPEQKEIVVSDDMIVTRNALARERTLTDSITVFDQALETYTEFVQVSAEIVIGIEVQ
jgi:hypothetical protein